MCQSVGQARCSVSHCSTQKEEAAIALYLRITFLALGIICLFVGFLSFAGVGGLGPLKWVGGGTACGITFIALSCMRYLKGSSFQSSVFAPQPLFLLRTLHPISDNVENGMMDKVSLQDLLSSQNSTDVRIRSEVEAELAIGNLEERLKDNLGEQVSFLSVEKKPKGKQALSKEAFTLFFLKDAELLSLKMENVLTYTPEKLNVLCLRWKKFRHAPCPAGIQENTIGSILNTPIDQIGKLPLPALLFLRKEQIETYLHSVQEITPALTDALFSVSNLTFIREWTQTLFNDFSIETVNKCLPYLGRHQMRLLIQCRGTDSGLNLDALGKEQVEKCFPFEIDNRAWSKNFMRELNISQFNALLPKMNGSLIRSMPQEMWINPALALERLSEELVDDLLRKEFISRIKEMMAQLSISQFNKLIPKMRGEWMRYTPKKILQNPTLNLKDLTAQQVEEMRDTGFGEKVWTTALLGDLEIGVLNHLLPKMNGEQLRLIPEKHLKDPHLDLDALTKEQVKEMLSTDFLVRPWTKAWLEKLDITSINKLLPKMNSEQLHLLHPLHWGNMNLNVQLVGEEKFKQILPSNGGELTRFFTTLGVVNIVKIIDWVTAEQLKWSPWAVK